MKASLQGKVRRRKAWCKSGCEGIGRYEAESKPGFGKFDDADDADGDHMVTIWATISHEKLSHGKTDKTAKKRGGEVVKCEGSPDWRF